MVTKAATKQAPARKKATARKRAASPSSSRATRAVSDQQKAAMQQGRQEGAAIRRYLEALKIEQGPKRRGRRRTPDQIRERVATIDAELNNGLRDPLAEVQLRQERLLLVSDLQESEPKAKSAEFEDGFVKAVKGYSERKGISYDVWRQLGVPVVALRKAGLSSR